MTPDQISLVQKSFAKVVPIREKAAELFYGRLFETDASAKPLFKNLDMKEQGQKLMTAIAMVVKGLNNLDQIAPFAQELGVRHVKYGVKPEHYDSVGNALLWTLEKGLGAEFTPQVKEAWTQAYTVLANTMKAAAYGKH